MVVAGPHPKYGVVVPRVPLIKIFRNHDWNQVQAYNLQKDPATGLIPTLNEVIDF